MTCAEFKELVALYAMGGLAGDERAAFEAHLRSDAAHDGCIDALDHATEILLSLEGDSPLPSPRVWEAIARRIAPSVQRLRRARLRSRIAAGVAIACAAALLLIVLRDRRTATALTAERDACLAQVELLDVLQLPGTKLYALAPEKGRTTSANAIMHTGIKRAYLVAEGLPSLPDSDYELWIAKGDRVVAAGLIKADAARTIVRVDYASLLGADAGAPDAMMITVEPKGGSDVVRGPTIAAGSLSKS